MNNTLISVCLPNLNTRPFLEERVETIFAQTHQNWELVISDNYSEDGAWEYFQDLAKRDPRVSIAQAPKQGLYPNWNNCLRRARGEYVYIATSDDTMAPDCLEKLARALDEHPDCDIAHCPLRVIDVQGRELSEPTWPDGTVFAHGLESVAGRPHIRRAPYDGLIHLMGQHVVLSITQILIRRSLFARTGEFGSRWGSVSDFNWEMKAGLVGSIVHVPDTWASWRLHPTQATAAVNINDPERDRKVEEMIEDAVGACVSYLPDSVAGALNSHLLSETRQMRAYYAGLRHRRSSGARRLFQLQQLTSGSGTVRAEIAGRVFARPKWSDIAPQHIREWLESIGMRPIEEVAASRQSS